MSVTTTEPVNHRDKISKKNKARKNDKKKQHSLVVSFSLKLGILIVILFLILCYFSIMSVSKGTEKNYQENMNGMIPTYSKTISLWTQNAIQDMHMYTQSDIVKTGTTDQIVNWMYRIKNRRSREFSDILFCAPDGIAHGQNSNGKNIDIKDRDYFKAIIQENKDVYIGNPVISRLDNSVILQICVATYNDANEKTGFFAGIMTLGTLQEIINETKIGNNGYLFVVDGTGTIIAHPDTAIMQSNLDKSGSGDFRYSKEMAAIAKEMTQRKTGNGDVYDQKAGRISVFYAPVDGTSWAVVAVVPHSQINQTASELAKTIALECAVIAILLIVTSAFMIFRSLKPLKNVISAISNIAQGNADLSSRIEETVRNEIGAVVTGFNRFIEKLQAIITDVKESKDGLSSAGNDLKMSLEDTSSAITQILSNIDNANGQIATQSASVQQTSGAVTEISQNIVSLEKMIENQSSGITEASAAVEQMIGNISSVNNSVEKMAESFTELTQNVQKGSEKQENVNVKIEQIESQSEMLQEANTVIAGIASQTNLLAMNAAIEAAHAGESGKGFSVVADEIRKLSETSTVQSKRIGDQLSKIKDSITGVVSASAESSAVFTTVSGRIKGTDELVQQIKQAMAEQSAGSKQINNALQLMNDSTAEVKTASAEMSAGQKAILAEIQHLQDTTLAMKESVNQMSQGATKIHETATSLSGIAVNVEKSIGKIGSQIDLFKV